MVCYKVLSDDDRLKFKTLWDEFEYLKSLGFKVPHNAKVKGVTGDTLSKAVKILLNYFEGLMDKREIPYACDGVVIAIDDNEIFYSLGKSGNSWNGNVAIKMGKYWESSIYSAVIKDIVFIPGKSYMTPKAIIEPVKTANVAEVTNVTLYNIGVMERYRYIPGETIYFRFGGEQGVLTCTPYGDSVRVNG